MNKLNYACILLSMSIGILITNTTSTMNIPMPGDPCIWCCCREKHHFDELKKRALLDITHKHIKSLSAMKQAPQAQEMKLETGETTKITVANQNTSDSLATIGQALPAIEMSQIASK